MNLRFDVPLCRDCEWKEHVPFTCGLCRRVLIKKERKLISDPTDAWEFPRCTDQRAWPDDGIRCGPSARYFVAIEDLEC